MALAEGNYHMLKLSAALAAAGLVLLALSAWPAPAPAAVASLPAPTNPPPTATPAPADLAVYGRALFKAKGCVTCHRHAAVPNSGVFGEGNPDLSSFRWTDEFLRKWLSDPAAVRPGTYMPKLNLAPDEIDALIAFLKASGGSASP